MAVTLVQQVQNLSAAVRQLQGGFKRALELANALTEDIKELKSRPRTITEEIDAIPGRRIETIFSGEVDFTAADDGNRGNPVIIQISQDGPFIQTHYPMILWYPTAPSDTDNLGRWRGVSSFPLPTQEIQGDYVDIKYEIEDNGSQRYLQNEARGPILSRPDNIVPLACPTEWSPASSVKITPFYQRISFTGSGETPTPPTAGTLYVALIGYRCVNL